LCSIDDELMMIHHLYLGKEIDGEYIIQLKREAACKKAFNRSLNYLSFKMRTEQEIIEDLIAKEFDKSVIQATLVKLRNYKYVDDENYILLYIRSKIAEGHSKRKIQYNLVKKGLDEENVLSQLHLNYPKDIELSYLKVQVEKSNEKYKQLPYRDRVAKINQSFLRKGYNHDDIAGVIAVVISRENEHSVEFMMRLEKLANDYMEKYLKKGCDTKESKFKTTQAMYRKGYDMDVIHNYFKLEKE